AVPAGRMDAALAALGFSVGSAAVSMLAVPYTAMFTAKQDIVEASAFQLAQTLIVFVFAAFMKIAISVSGRGGVDWLVAYAAALALTSAALAAAQVWRVRSKYRECRIDAGLMFGGGRVKPLLAFAGWQFLGGFAWTVRSQGLAFFVNVLFGTAYNASYTISTQVSNHAASLSSSLNNALSPVLSAAEGGGRRPEVMRLARFGNRLGGALALAFAVPLALFMDDVLKLWLVEPPPGCALLCTAMLAVAVLRQFTAGCGLAILARGGLGPWQICDALAIAAALPAAWLLWRCGLGIASIGWAFVLSETAEAAVRVYFSGKMRNE
ncbi:MAG: hypothetical protein J6T01_01265, partial [Kiritimatiellae bacterium]|nr:hypothetical protein [Kiritimatiellia bacterium]